MEKDEDLIEVLEVLLPPDSPSDGDQGGLRFLLCPHPAPPSGARRTVAAVPAKESGAFLLQRLHLKFKQKPWLETMKLVRHCLVKPIGNALRGARDNPLIHSLEKLQRSLKVRSFTTMVNRLELLSKQKGLEYHVSPTGKGCYITSDMFYVEVVVKKNGDVVDVKLAHHGETPTVCEELLSLLRSKNFDAFGQNLDGLLAMYQIPGDSVLKANVHRALRCIEQDLMGIYNLYRNATNADRVSAILHGPVGYLVPRSGGSPMSIEYFASPYHLLEENCNPGSSVLGMKALITVGGTSLLNTLPVTPLFAVTEPPSASNVTFLPMTADVCMDIPACFFLTFLQPIPIMMCLLEEIQNITGLPFTGTMVHSLYDLIIRTKLPEHKEKLTEKQYFLVTLPDVQKQSYFINKSSWKGDVLLGVLVSKIHFTHPRHVPFIIEVLRRQSTYNTIIGSCVTQTKADTYLSEFLQFEISPQTDTCLCVTFQNPVGSSLACVSIDVLSSRQIQCSLHVDSESLLSICTNEFIGSVMQRCMSIPVTMRAILKKAANAESVCEIQTSVLDTEQPQPLTVEEVPSASPTSGTIDGLEIPQCKELNVAAVQVSGSHIEACSKTAVLDELDLSDTETQLNGHSGPFYSPAENVNQPEEDHESNVNVQ